MKFQIPLIILLIICIISPVWSDEDFPYIYRGQMGNFGIIENIHNHHQKLVSQGKDIEGYNVLSISADEIVLSGKGKEFKVKIFPGYSESHLKVYSDPGTPDYLNLSWKEALLDKLNNTFLRLRYRGVPLEQVLSQISEDSDIKISLDPDVLVHNSPFDLTITLTTGELSLKRALDLIVTSLGLVYYLSEIDGVVVSIRANVPPPSKAEQILDNIYLAKEKAYKENQQEVGDRIVKANYDAIMGKLDECRVTLDFKEVPIKKVVAIIGERIDVPIVVAPLPTSTPSSSVTFPGYVSLIQGEVSVRQALDYLCKETGLKWTIEGTSIYIAPATPLSSQMSEIWEDTKEQRQKKAEIEESLQQKKFLEKRLSVNFDMTPLNIVVEWLKAQNISLVVDPEIWEQGNLISFQGDISLKEFLYHLSKVTGGAYTFFEGDLYLVR